MVFPTTLRFASKLSTIASLLMTAPVITRATTAPPISPAINAAFSSSHDSSIAPPLKFHTTLRPNAYLWKGVVIHYEEDSF